MGTNALFTRQPIHTYSALELSSFSPVVSPSFEYYDCSKWKSLLQDAKNCSGQTESDEQSEYVCSEPFPSSPTTLLHSNSTSGLNTKSGSAVVHLVIPDGTIQGTQLAHHLISAMLCQNPQLLHINAMQAILSSVLVYLLKQPFKSQAWLQRQLEWVAMSYSRAYTYASCKGAISEHRRFEQYMDKLCDSKNFRLCLISDALDHPRELKCPGLSKAILGMWMTTHSPTSRNEKKNISATLLRKWKLGLTAEMFHRLGLTLDIQVIF
jgi:hypothetical protein